MSAMDWFNRNLSWPNPIKGGIKLFVESIKEFKENVNIYELSGPESYPIGINALFYALNNNNKKIANKLLDIFEKDLKTLDKWNLSSALVVQDQLLIDEVLSICENEFVDGSEPVLIKYNNNSEQNKIVFLRIKLKDRKDPSLLLKEKIQKNGICDVNWQPESLGGDTLLHYAVAGGMSEIVDRLLKIPMIKKQIKNSKGLSPLYYACSRGQYQSAILLASGDTPINFWEEDSEQNNLALLAAIKGNLKMTQFVIEKMTSASDPNAENIAYDSLMKYQRANDSKGDRFIHVAVQRGNVHLVNRSIIRNKDIVFLQNNDGETIMHILASYCYVQNGDRCTNLKKFANKYPDLLLIEDKKGQLPIHCAVFYSYELEFLKILWDLTVQAGGDDKIFFKDQKMAFDLIANCSMGVLEFVLEKSRHLSDKFGVRLLNRLCREEMWTDSHLGVIRFLISICDDLDPNKIFNGRSAFLETAANLKESKFYTDSLSFCRSKLRILMDHKPIKNVNEVDEQGNSILMYLVGFGMDCGFLKELVALGADLSVINKENNSLIHQAANNPNPDVLEWLLSLNIDTQLVNDKGEKAIMIAVQKENAEIIQILLPFETLPELNRQNFEGDTLLHILLRQYYNQSSNKLINQLLDLKIDVTIKNKSGNLPQHCTECIHSFEILHKHCIKEGIELDVNVKNDEGVCCFTDRFGYWFNDIAKYVTDNFLEKLDYSVRFRENKNLLHYFCLAEFNEFEDLFKDEIFQEKCVRELVNEKDDNGQTPLDFALATDVKIFMYWKLNNICFPLHLMSKHDMVQNLPKIVEQSRMILMDKVHSLHPTIFKENPSCLITAIEHLTDIEILFFLMDKIDKQAWEDLQILHKICDKNDKMLVDQFLKKIEVDQFRRLNKIKDQNGRSPYELLNETNKSIFEAVFSQ